MKILVFNAGSSSVKCTLFDMTGEKTLARGLVERIGLAGTFLRFDPAGGDLIERETGASSTTEGVRELAGLLEDSGLGGEIAAVGHRVVHGGEDFRSAVLVDERVKSLIRARFELAPLHNPPNLHGIEAAEKLYPGVPQTAVFDTAFHADIPDYAYLYALPYSFYKEHGIRRYGFHGISHKYVASEAARMIERPLKNLRLITCHLGAGCSVAAVNRGRSVDTSMGFTPLEGLIMGTRCGDLDPAVVFFLMERKNLSRQEVEDLLNRGCGLLGMSGTGSGDVRDVLAAARAGEKRALTALQAFAYRIKKYIGGYAAIMGGLDGLVFTAGIGENSFEIRETIVNGYPDLTGLGLAVDPERNRVGSSGAREIQPYGAAVKVLVIPTNEELEIARQTRECLDRA